MGPVARRVGRGVGDWSGAAGQFADLEYLARHPAILGGQGAHLRLPHAAVPGASGRLRGVTEMPAEGVVVLAATPIGDVADASPRLLA